MKEYFDAGECYLVTEIVWLSAQSIIGYIL